MDIYINGFFSDLKNEKESVKKYLSEYRELNTILEVDENRYENILLSYGTEDLKIATGFLTVIYKNLDLRGHTVVDSIFDTLESKKDYEISVFYTNRIIEKYSSDEIEDILIRIKTLKRTLNILVYLQDKYFFVLYLQKFLDELNKLNLLINIKSDELYKNISSFNQFMYIFYLTIMDDKEKAIGYLIKDIDLRDYLFSRNLLKFPFENNIFHVINLTGLYFQLNDSLLTLAVDIEQYILKLRDEIKRIRDYINKNPHHRRYFINYEFRKYFSDFLANIYIAGYEDYYLEIADIIPELITNDHKLTIKIINLSRSESILSDFEIDEIRSELNIISNNISGDKKYRLLYLFYNLYITNFRENPEKLKKIVEEINKLTKKSILLKIPLFRAYNYLGEREKGLKIAEDVKRELIIKGNDILAKSVEKYIEDEF
ncbi:hypothetical protein [Persephonella sp.]